MKLRLSQVFLNAYSRKAYRNVRDRFRLFTSRFPPLIFSAYSISSLTEYVCCCLLCLCLSEKTRNRETPQFQMRLDRVRDSYSSPTGLARDTMPSASGYRLGEASSFKYYYKRSYVCPTHFPARGGGGEEGFYPFNLSIWRQFAWCAKLLFWTHTHTHTWINMLSKRCQS